MTLLHGNEQFLCVGNCNRKDLTFNGMNGSIRKLGLEQLCGCANTIKYYEGNAIFPHTGGN